MEIDVETALARDSSPRAPARPCAPAPPRPCRSCAACTGSRPMPRPASARGLRRCRAKQPAA
eukprot:4453167-Pleurochrysis_carterae.AAC.1